VTTYGIVAFDHAEELDIVGPWEVFGASTMVHEKTGGPADHVLLIAETMDPAHAKTVQHYIQYNPAPPYQAENLIGSITTTITAAFIAASSAS
jgi:hypothetical protein